MAITREELYDAVWSEPVSTVAERYEVSSTFLAQVADRLNVPTPKRGHWQKLAAGYAADKPALPPSQPWHEQTWTRGPVRKFVYVPTVPTPSPNPRRRKPVVSQLHPLLTKTVLQLEAAPVDPSGYARPATRDLVDIVTAPAQAQRAVALASTLFRHFEAHDHLVVLAPRDAALCRFDLDHRLVLDATVEKTSVWASSRPTVVFIGQVAISLTIFELSEPRPAVFTDDKWGLKAIVAKRKTIDSPCGKLAIRARSPYCAAPDWQVEWRERNEGDLVKRIPAIAKTIIDATPEVAATVQEGQRKIDEERRRWERDAEASRKRFEQAERVRAREGSRNELLALIENWHVDEKIVAFFREARAQIETIADETKRLAAMEKLANARGMFATTTALDSLHRWRSDVIA